MDEELKQKMRDALLERWERTGKQLKRDENVEADLAQPQAEIIDIAQALEQLERDSSLKEQGRRGLVAIERALTKMSSGSFGVCEDCGEEIPQRRLLAIPEARL